MSIEAINPNDIPETAMDCDWAQVLTALETTGAAKIECGGTWSLNRARNNIRHYMKQRDIEIETSSLGKFLYVWRKQCK